jgi:hypothetical protein
LAAALEVRELVTRVIRAGGWLVAERPADVLKDRGLACAAAADNSVVLGPSFGPLGLRIEVRTGVMFSERIDAGTSKP